MLFLTLLLNFFYFKIIALFVFADPPTLDMDIRDKMMVKVGDSCTLSGRFSGKPAPIITWTKNDEEQKTGEEISLHSTARHLSLTVNRAKREHSGRYSVTVENAAGSRTGLCTITVVGTYTILALPSTCRHI